MITISYDCDGARAQSVKTSASEPSMGAPLGLPAVLSRQLEGHCSSVGRGEFLHAPEDAGRSVFFIHDGAFSLLGCDRGRACVEVAMLGEGDVLGLPQVSGSAPARTAPLAIVDSTVGEIPGEELRLLSERDVSVANLLNLRMGRQMQQMHRLSVCHARHRIVNRLASWIVAASRWAGGDAISITHGRISQILGTRRASVTEAVHLLEGEGAIYAKRQSLQVRDLETLQRLSCGCRD